jgi:CHASE3 domain sensor protein
MTERATLEERLKEIHQALEQASPTFESSVQAFSEVLGSRDAPRIDAARDAMQTWSEMVKGLTEEQRALQRRLEYLTTQELTRDAITATRASTRAAWATFWVALFGMVASTTAAIMAAVVASA